MGVRSKRRRRTASHSSSFDRYILVHKRHSSAPRQAENRVRASANLEGPSTYRQASFRHGPPKTKANWRSTMYSQEKHAPLNHSQENIKLVD